MIYGLSQYKPLDYQGYVYPSWANAFGWIMAGSSMACIPVGAVIMVIKHKVWIKDKLESCECV